jgi:LCP family protein required for cell wall assembly
MDDSDPFERYFRPRQGGQAAAEDDAFDGISIDDTRAPRVAVSRGKHGGRRHGAGDSDGPDRPARSAGSRNIHRQRRMLFVAAAMSGVVLASSGGAWAFQGYVTESIKKVDPFADLGGRPDSGPKGAMNILIAGVDRREGLSRQQIDRLHLGRDAGARSDTMMLLHVSANHDKVTIVNLPRDSLVTIPAHKSNGSESGRNSTVADRPGKLSWSYQFGGPALAVKTIERATGVRINHYVEVNFLGFVKMVDALGGVTVCTEQPINDRRSGLQLPAGKNHVDGLKGLAFARARYSLTGGSDLSRIGRQQQFMAAMMQQALSTSTLTDPVKFTNFLEAMLKTVRVDPDLAKNVNALAKQMRRLTTDSVVFADVPLANSNRVTSLSGTPQSTVQWDGRGASTLFSQIKKDQPVIKPKAPAASKPPAGPARPKLTVPPGQITVGVLNGVGTPGVARKATGQLRQAGFASQVIPGTAKKIGVRTTIIQYGPGREDSARTLAAAIPGAKLKALPALGSRVQVIVGSNWSKVRQVKVAAPRAADKGIRAGTATQKICK